MTICAKCKWAVRGIELITDCDHPKNLEFCPVQGTVSYSRSVYYWNGQGNCPNFEARKPEDQAKKKEK
jgi:hypothetical protein